MWIMSRGQQWNDLLQSYNSMPRLFFTLFQIINSHTFLSALISQSNWIFVRTEIFNWYNIQSLLNPNFKKEYTHSNFWIRLLSRVQTQEKAALYKCSWVMESWGLSSRTWQESKKNLLSWTLQIKQPCKQQIPNSSPREKLCINL